MPLSSQTLFHFTSEFKYLKSIIEGKFYPRISLEAVPSIDRKTKERKGIHAAYPMVCFCDIPLSQVKNHIEFYGDYGIGLTKEWGKNQGLNPIIYLDKDSKLIDHFVHLASEIFKPEYKGKEEYIKLKRNFHEINRFLKPYSGPNIDRNNESKIEEYIFYDEKEWRYVPDGFLYDEEYYIKKDQFEDKRYVSSLNKELEVKALPFKAKDISYIIVNHDHEIGKMIDFIEKSEYPARSVKMLISKIQTKQQIMNDF